MVALDNTLVGVENELWFDGITELGPNMGRGVRDAHLTEHFKSII